MPKIGIQSGAHLLNCLSGGWSLQHVTNHFGRGEHDLKIIYDNEVVEIRVPSEHSELMVAGPQGIALGWAQEAFLKRGEDFKRRYTPEERKKEWDDEEVIFYEQTNSLCFQFDPAEGNAGCQHAFFDLTWKAINSKL